MKPTLNVANKHKTVMSYCVPQGFLTVQGIKKTSSLEVACKYRNLIKSWSDLRVYCISVSDE